MKVLSLASTGTVVSSPCRRSPASTVTADQFNERRQARRAGADPVRQGRHVELDALAGIGFALPVEGLMLAKLGIKDHRQQAGAGACSGDDMERRRWLGDLLA